jgi:hypothetical protein
LVGGGTARHERVPALAILIKASQQEAGHRDTFDVSPGALD